MARRTRSGIRMVKKEDLDDEDISNTSPSLPPVTATSTQDEPKSKMKRLLSNTLGGGLVACTASAGGSAASSCSSSVLTSRFFPSPAASTVRGRKRKTAASVGGNAGGGGAVSLKGKCGRHEAIVAAGDGSRRASKKAGTPPGVTTPPTASPSISGILTKRRSCSRLSAVKKEELAEALAPSKLSSPVAAVADTVGGGKGNAFTKAEFHALTRRALVAPEVGVGLQEPKPEKKQVGKGKHASKKLKTEGVEGGNGVDGVREKAIPPRLAEKAALIVQVMDKLYPDPPIPINHLDSFTLLCGVLLSAQTTDAQVNLVTRELFRVAPNPQSLSEMAQEDLQKIIRSVGLAPTKAKHLIALSQQLLERFDGKVPQTFEGLQSLPGVGRKTAAVVMVQAFNTPAFPVDTHIHRLALRWGLSKNEKNASKVEEDLMALFPRESWAKLHLQFIYFGREHCQARVHDASACPICCWVKKTGSGSPKALAELTCLKDYLAFPTPPKKSSKNAIVYSERILEMEQFKMKLDDTT